MSSNDSNNSVVFRECLDHSYKLSYTLHLDRRGGGVALLIKDGINVTQQDHHPQRSFECIELLITTVSIHVRVVVIYRPSTSKIKTFTQSQCRGDFSKFLKGLSTSSDRLLICDDLNINWLNETHNKSKYLFNILATFNLYQHIDNSTHKNSHLLDYVIGDNQLINSVSLSDFVSDHCTLHATITCTSNHQERKKITHRCLKNTNSDQLSIVISNIEFKIYSTDVDLIVDNYNSIFSSFLDTHAPLKTDHVISRDLQSWMSEEILFVKR